MNNVMKTKKTAETTMTCQLCGETITPGGEYCNYSTEVVSVNMCDKCSDGIAEISEDELMQILKQKEDKEKAFALYKELIKRRNQ